MADRAIQDQALSFHIGEKPPLVSHFIAQPLPSKEKNRDNDNNGANKTSPV
jgi:hypothetical protein